MEVVIGLAWTNEDAFLVPEAIGISTSADSEDANLDVIMHDEITRFNEEHGTSMVWYEMRDHYMLCWKTLLHKQFGDPAESVEQLFDLDITTALDEFRKFSNSAGWTLAEPRLVFAGDCSGFLGAE